jgi:hypothetical protein
MAEILRAEFGGCVRLAQKKSLGSLRGLQGDKVARLQGYKVTRLQGYKVTRLHEGAWAACDRWARRLGRAFSLDVTHVTMQLM